MTLLILKRLCALCICGLFVLSASNAVAADFDADLREGISAYRTGDYETSWQLLYPVAEAGNPKAQRYLGYILLSDDVPPSANDSARSGIEYLEAAARGGDYAALIRLEKMRRSGEADAPDISDMIGIEIERAENGDPVAAWRLAERYETGDGVEASEEETARWLKVAAEAGPDVFPKSREAAFRLCQHYAVSGGSAAGEAVDWCRRAAEDGHAGAAIMLRRIAQLAE